LIKASLNVSFMESFMVLNIITFLTWQEERRIKFHKM